MDETLAPGSGPSSGTFVPETPWLRRNNPLYAASALCILLGVYLASRDLESSVGGRIAFAGVLEVYAGLLIAGATWLVRLGQTRSAGTLALLSVFFLVDPTLRVEGMVTTDQLAVPLLAAWAALAVLKLWLIGLPYGIELRLRTHLPALVVVVATVAIPHWVRSVPSQHAIAATVSTWLGAALIASANAHVPRLSGPSGLERALRALPWLFAGGYHYHLFVTLYAYDVEFGMVQLVPYLALFPLFASSPKACLMRSLAVVAFAATVASALSPMALAVCAVLAIRGARERAPSLQAAAVIAGLLGAWSWGAVRYPLRPILPEGTLRSRWEWALIVVALGFVALGAGFAVDYLRSRQRSPAKAES